MPEPSSRTDRAVLALRGLWESDPTPACYLDGHLRIVYGNPAFERLASSLWRVAASALLGRRLPAVLPAPLRLALERLDAASDPVHLTEVDLAPPSTNGAAAHGWNIRLMPMVEAGALTGVGVLFDDRTAEAARAETAHTQLQLHQALLSATDDAVVWISADGQAHIENEAAAAVFGAARAGAGVPVRDLASASAWLTPAGAAPGIEREPFAVALAGRALGATAYRLRRSGTPDRLFRVTVTPVLALHGGPGASLMILRPLGEAPLDVPSAPSAPMFAHAFMQGMLEAIPAVLYYLDTDLRVQMANPYFLSRLGRQAGQVLGQPLKDLLSLSDAYAGALQDAMAGEVGVHLPHFAYTDPATGERTYWDNYFTPVRDEQGQTQGLMVLSNDVTWRVALTRTLKTQVHQLAAIVGHIADGVLVATPTGELLLVNRAAQALLKLPPASTLANVEQFDIRSMDDRPMPLSEMPISKVLRGETVSGTMIKVLDQDGQERVLATNGSPILDQADRVSMGVLVFHDYTEEYRLRQALTDKIHELEEAICSLKELDRLKSDFLDTVSHELRTPLTNIIGYVELIADGLVGSLVPAQQEVIGKVMDNARHLLRLINDLLDLTQLEAGKVAFSYSPVDMAALADTVLSGAKGKNSKEMAIAVAESGPVPRARADYNRVMQVLEHLLDNAFKFTPACGRIELMIDRNHDGTVRVEVRDTGIGIASEDLPHLFSKFHQVETGLRREQGGTGLGLAICKMLIERQGGHIGIASEPGRGTRVWFTLPPWSDTDALDARTSPSGAA